MSRKVGFWTELLDTLKDLFDLIERSIAIYSENSVVINPDILERIESETETFRGYELTPIADDPLGSQFNLADLLDPDATKALESVSRFEANYLDFAASIERRQNEIDAVGVVSSEWANQSDQLYGTMQEVDRILPKVSPWIKDLPFWYADAHAIHAAMGERNIGVENLLKRGTNELNRARERFAELQPWTRDVELWGRHLQEEIRAKGLQHRADEIYRELTERLGGDETETIRRQLAGLLAVMTASNADVKARAERMRAEAERRRDSDVGPDILDLLTKLVSLGSLTDSKQEAKSKSGPSIYFRYERHDHYFYPPKSPRPKEGPRLKKKT